MFQKTTVREKSKAAHAPEFENKQPYGGKALPAVAPAQLMGEEEEAVQGKFDPVQKMEEEEALQGKFEPIQKVEEEEPMQGKFDPVQKMEEEEPMQGKFDPVQKMEEEEPMQGKFDPVQKMDEEEPMQGKFDPVQRMEEEEPMQGKFDPIQKMEEEEPMQGKFEPVQKVEEEEPMQGKFEPIQKVEEEEPVQGKFEPIQKVEEEPMQGKFEPIQKMEEEEPMQGKFEPIQKVEEEEPMQGKFSPGAPVQPKSGRRIDSNTVTQRVEDGGTPNKTGMPSNLKSGIESLSGFAMDDVKVHYNSDKPKQLQALAYAQGTDIHIAPGQEQHLPHEAWHVAQQKQGRVKPTLQMKQGVPVNDDAGLENEADVMGAKAVAQGKDMEATAQLKFNPSLLSGKNIAQRKVVQRNPELTRGRASRALDTETPDAKFQRENAPVISMISNASTVLSTVPWASLAAGSDDVGTAASVGGLVGSLTGAAGAVTNVAKKQTGPDIQGAAGDITAGIGSTIGSLVKSVVAIKNLYATAKGNETKLVGGGEIAIAILGALKAGCEAAVSIQKFVSGSVPPGMASLIPGLGIAIAACEIIKNAYTSYNAYSAEAEMTGVSGEFRADLVTLLGGAPETSAPSLFASEKRGKLGSRITYLRLKPGLFESIASIKDTGITPEQRATRSANFRRIHGIPSSVNIDSLVAAIRYYELGSKMQEINQKRKVQGARNIFTSMLSLAGEIAKFFPADGGITAGVLLGASAAVGAAQSAGKFIQGLARNNGVLGGDTNRSGASKHKEYVNHTRTIYEFLSSVPQPVVEAQKPKVDRCEQLLKSTGVNLTTVYATEYGDAASVRSQVNLIIDAMKSGR